MTIILYTAKLTLVNAKQYFTFRTIKQFNGVQIVFDHKKFCLGIVLVGHYWGSLWVEGSVLESD